MAQKKSWYGSIFEFIGLLLLVFLIRTFGFGLYQVPTGSMETTMLVGERFFADKFTYLFRAPRNNEIIAMNAPESIFDYSKNPLVNLFQRYVWGPDNWTKRVIGVPGDTVRGSIEDGKPRIYLKKTGDLEFTKLEEPYLNKYPLISVYIEDPKVLHSQLEKENKLRFLLEGIPRSLIDRATIDQSIRQLMLNYYTLRKSYDPEKSYEDQPFYIINPEHVARDLAGNPYYLWPGTPRYAKNPDKYNQAVEEDKTYWEKNGSDEFYVKLGEDEYWLMGDNRRGSEDSRFIGPVKGKNIHGRIIFRIWSIDSHESWWILDLIKHPIDFWRRVRWNRFFQIIS